MNKLLIVAALSPLLMAGMCGSREPPAVEIPVRVPCVNGADMPPETPPAGELPSDARQASDLLGSVVLQLRGEVRTLRALIGPCVR